MYTMRALTAALLLRNSGWSLCKPKASSHRPLQGRSIFLDFDLIFYVKCADVMNHFILQILKSSTCFRCDAGHYEIRPEGPGFRQSFWSSTMPGLAFASGTAFRGQDSRERATGSQSAVPEDERNHGTGEQLLLSLFAEQFFENLLASISLVAIRQV